jgi:hypothetical protein
MEPTTESTSPLEAGKATELLTDDADKFPVNRTFFATRSKRLFVAKVESAADDVIEVAVVCVVFN